MAARKLELEKDDGEKVTLGHKMFEFPYDIMHDILLRLPFDSLRRLKFVCKQSRALISDPHLVKSQLKLTNNKGYEINYLHAVPYKIRQLHGRQVYCDKFPKPVLVTSTDSKQPTKIINRKADFPTEFLPSIDKDGVVCVLGSCEGLLLLINGMMDTTFLWNPSTGQCKTFRDSNFRNGSDCFFNDRGHYYVSGLGYDRLRDEYKGVVIVKRIMLVFSSKNGKWKKVESDFATGRFRYHVGIAVNGAPHWIQEDRFNNDTSYSNRIVYFDAAGEKLKTLSMPNAGRITPYLSLLEGCLCVLHYKKDDYCRMYLYNAWVMKEYGVENSWTKCVSFNIKRIHGNVTYAETLVSPWHT